MSRCPITAPPPADGTHQRPCQFEVVAGGCQPRRATTSPHAHGDRTNQYPRRDARTLIAATPARRYRVRARSCRRRRRQETRPRWTGGRFRSERCQPRTPHKPYAPHFMRVPLGCATDSAQGPPAAPRLCGRLALLRQQRRQQRLGPVQWQRGQHVDLAAQQVLAHKIARGLVALEMFMRVRARPPARAVSARARPRTRAWPEKNGGRTEVW